MATLHIWNSLKIFMQTFPPNLFLYNSQTKALTRAPKHFLAWSLIYNVYLFTYMISSKIYVAYKLAFIIMNLASYSSHMVTLLSGSAFCFENFVGIYTFLYRTDSFMTSINIIFYFFFT